MSVAATATDALLQRINGSTPSARTGVMQEVQDRFLRLLVTQLQHQDPMNPMDNAEITSQLAQMSTVEGISSLNKAMSELLASYRASQTLMATAFLDRAVLTSGEQMRLFDGRAGGAVELAGPADRVSVEILDEAGRIARTLELGPQNAGMVPFSWDGKNQAGQDLNDGVYRLRARAWLAGQSVDVAPLTLKRVQSISFTGGDVALETDLGSLTLAQIKRVY